MTAGYAIKYADELNYVFLGPDEIAERMAAVRARCEEEGRDPATLRFSLYASDEDFREAGQARVDLLAAFAAIGLDRIVCFPTRWSPTLEAQAAFAEDCLAGRACRSAPRTCPGSAPNRRDSGRVAEPGSAHEQLDRDRAVPARVDRFAEAGRGRRVVGRVAEQPGLVVGEFQHAVRERDPVARAGRDALHREVVALGFAEDDDAAAPGPSGRRGVDQEPVAVGDGRQHARLRDGDPPRAPRGGPRATPSAAAAGWLGYFLVAQKMSLNSLTAASSWAAASASTFCLFLPASFSSFQTLSWRSGLAVEVLRLEVVGPDDLDLVLDLLGVLFLDVDAAGELVARPRCRRLRGR